jgi:hypothetical protein
MFSAFLQNCSNVQSRRSGQLPGNRKVGYWFVLVRFSASETRILGLIRSFGDFIARSKVRCIEGMILRRSYEDSAMSLFRSTRALRSGLFGVSCPPND